VKNENPGKKNEEKMEQLRSDGREKEVERESTRGGGVRKRTWRQVCWRGESEKG